MAEYLGVLLAYLGVTCASLIIPYHLLGMHLTHGQELSTATDISCVTKVLLYFLIVISKIQYYVETLPSASFL